MQNTRMHFSIVTILLVMTGLLVPSIGKAAAENSGTQPAFNPLGGRPASAACNRAYALLLEGKEKEAYEGFKNVVKANPKEAPALFGLGQLEALRGNASQAFDLYARAFAEGRNEPWAEIFLDTAVAMLPYCTDPQPLLKVIQSVEADPKAKSFLKDRALQAKADWLLQRGDFEGAAKAYAPLQFLSKWALIGPFDNRDKAGLRQEFVPETEINFERAVQGRNRKVSWFFPKAAPMTGIVDLSQIFEPNTHSLAYAVTHMRVPNPQWAVLRLGCAGAVRVWLNDREILTVSEYNEYASEKAAVPIYLQKGVNRVLVKSAVVEEVLWAFSVRLSLPDGGPVPGLVIENGPEVLKAYKEGSTGRSTPLLEPNDPDLGVLVQLRSALKKNPNDPLLQAFLGFEMDLKALGNLEDQLAVKEFKKAIKTCPKCPLFRMMLADVSTDVNQSRMAIEQCLADHPHLPAPYEALARHAYDSGLKLTSEKYARMALKKFGLERAPLSAYYLAYIIQERGQMAEAFRMASKLTRQAPYHSGHWMLLLELQASNAARRKTLAEALKYCGGDSFLRQSWASQLVEMEQDQEGAAYLTAGIAQAPYDTGSRIAAAEAWRRAGQPDKATAVLEQAREIAPQNPELLSELGTAAFYADKTGEAIMLWQEVLKIKPNSPAIKDQLAELAKGKGLDREFFAPYDIELKDLSFPDAKKYPKDNAVTVLNQTVVQVNPNGTSSRMVHQVSKLLRPEGKQQLAGHNIYFDPQRQVVDVLKAAVITPEGQELSRASVMNRTVSAAMGMQTKIYDEHHLKQIFFRDLEVGSIVDLQYVIRDTGGNIYGDYFADVFYVGDSQPVMKSQYLLNLPKTRTFKTQTFRMALHPERVPSKDPEREIFKWEATDRPGIEVQRLMPPAVDTLPFIQTTSMRTWQEVGEWYWNLAQDQIQVTDEMKKTVLEITKDAETKTDKLRAVHDWVIRKIRYLGIEFGRNGFKPHRSSTTFKALYGDCKDTATLITAMLRVVNIESKLVLVRTVNAGKVEADCLPAPNLFNHCIAYVPDADGKDYWLDCTTDYHQLGEVPYSDQGAQVLVVGADGGRFVQIPKGTTQENLVEQRIDATLKKDGSGTIFIRETRRGQEAPYYRQAAATPGQFRRIIETRGARRFPGAKLLRLNNSKPMQQGPMWVETEFNVPKLAVQSGERLSLSSTIEPLSLSARYLTPGERKHDLELYFPRARKNEINYHLDEGFAIVNLPEDFEVKEAFGHFSRKVTKDGTIIRIRDDFEISNQRISKEQYSKFKTFCDSVDAVLEKKILIRRK